MSACGDPRRPPSLPSPEEEQRKQAGKLYICPACDEYHTCRWREFLLKWTAEHSSEFKEEEAREQVYTNMGTRYNRRSWSGGFLFIHRLYCTNYWWLESEAHYRKSPCECCSIRKWCKWRKPRETAGKVWIDKPSHTILSNYDYNRMIDIYAQHCTVCRDRQRR